MGRPVRPDPAAGAPGPAWHTLDGAETVRRLSSDAEAGLTAQEAATRLDRHGPNRLREGGRRSGAALLWAQFTDVMILILLAAAGVAAVAGDPLDAAVILAIVLLNAVIGWLQSLRAERAIDELRRLGALHATVVRGGQQLTVPAAELVPGDLVLLEAGAAVPADLRLLLAPQLRANESALTGESVPVDKSPAPLRDPLMPLAERTCMVFKGSTVSYGRARAIVVATGMETELGRVAGLLAAVPPTPTPLQQRLARFGRQLALAVLAVCALIFATGLLRGEPPMLMLLTALSLAVAAIPEALPAVVTMMLALGARAMAARQALVRRLPAVETLGSVSCICTDKTGTLTCNAMRLVELTVGAATERLPAGDHPSASAGALLRAAAACNDAVSDADGSIIGDPTEAALLEAAIRAGIAPLALARDMPREAERAFDADRKRMTTIHREDGRHVAYTKGAPESVLGRCTRAGDQPLDADARARLLALAESMAADGLRVLALARRAWDHLPQGEADTIERELELLGLVGLLDPPRPEARAAVARCRSAGIRPVMITGDHPATATAIARRLDMFDSGDQVVSGRELRAMSEPELAGRIAGVRIFARVDPEQKIRIVQAVGATGQYVAMTGDGINDAPALAAADIGVAMGRSGTDVAREAASLVLLDDNFATIVAAVEEGRRIFDNLRKFVRYVLACNLAEILVILLAPLLGLPMPLLPIHILWINLVTDGLPGLALAAEPAERGTMERPPRPPRQSLFAEGTWQHILWVGAALAAATLLVQASAWRADVTHWRTMTFTVLALAQLGQAMAVRTEREPLLARGLTSNRPMLGAVLFTVALQLAAVYLPVGNRLLRTAPLTIGELLLCLAVAAAVPILVELEKGLRLRRGRPGRDDDG